MAWIRIRPDALWLCPDGRPFIGKPSGPFRAWAVLDFGEGRWHSYYGGEPFNVRQDEAVVEAQTEQEASE